MGQTVQRCIRIAYIRPGRGRCRIRGRAIYLPKDFHFNTLTVELERLECRLVKQEVPDDRLLDLYQRVSNTLRRLLESIGLERRAKDITPDLHKFIAAENAARGDQ